MIKEMKDIIENIIINHTAVVQKNIGKRQNEEKSLLSARAYPCVCLLTADGRFDETNKRSAKYHDGVSGMWKEVFIRGERIIPIEIRVWGKTEDETDSVLGAIIRNLPVRWEWNNYGGRISILSERHSDYAAQVTGRALSSCMVEFSIEVGTDPVDIPTATEIEIGSQEYAH